MPDDWKIRFVYEREPVDRDTLSEDNFTDDFQTLLENLPGNDGTIPSLPPPLSPVPPGDIPDRTEVTAIANWLFEQQREWIESESPGCLTCFCGGRSAFARVCRVCGARSRTSRPTWLRLITTFPTTGTSAGNGASRSTRVLSVLTSFAMA